MLLRREVRGRWVRVLARGWLEARICENGAGFRVMVWCDSYGQGRVGWGLRVIAVVTSVLAESSEHGVYSYLRIYHLALILCSLVWI